MSSLTASRRHSSGSATASWTSRVVVAVATTVGVGGLTATAGGEERVGGIVTTRAIARGVDTLRMNIVVDAEGAAHGAATGDGATVIGEAQAGGVGAVNADILTSTPRTQMSTQRRIRIEGTVAAAAAAARVVRPAIGALQEGTHGVVVAQPSRAAAVRRDLAFQEEGGILEYLKYVDGGGENIRIFKNHATQ